MTGLTYIAFVFALGVSLVATGVCLGLLTYLTLDRSDDD